MSGQAGSDQAAVECIERRQERRRAVALVVVRHRLAASLLERQAGLRAIENLDLRFFGEGEDQRVFGQREVESDDIVEFCGATGVVAELESVDAMRFAARPRGVFFDAGDAGLDKAVPPARDQLAPDGHLCGDWFILPTVGGEQDNLGSQREANRDRTAAGLSLQLLALGFGQCHSWCCSHLFLLPDEDLANKL